MMVRRPGVRALRVLYGIGLASPELQVAPGQPFVEPDEWQRMWDHDILLAAYLDGEPVGFVHAVPWRESGCIVYLAVAGEHRRRGVGRALAEHAIRELYRVGVRHVYAWARRGSAVNKLCDAFGFRKGGQFTYRFR